jgi:hypothetical protein
MAPARPAPPPKVAGKAAIGDFGSAVLSYYYYVYNGRAGKTRDRFNKREGVMKAAILLALGFGIAVSSAAQAQGKDPPGVNPTHFLCYRVSQAAPLKPPAAVKLADQFGALGTKIGNALFMCTPVSKNGEEMKDKTTHLTCYSVSAKNAGKKVKVTHQLGSQVLTVGGSVVLCLPSIKEVLK